MTVRLTNICKRYGDKAVLQNVSLTLPPGVTCLMGASGSGKTTLLRILLGLEKADAGEIAPVSERVAVLFQEDRLIETLTVRANLRLALGRAYDGARAAACLDALGLPDILPQTVGTLSGGMKRRVALARALLFDAPLLALDEPFQGLDHDSRALAQSAVRQAAQGRPTLLVTHDESDCAALGGRVYTLAMLSAGTQDG